MKIAILGTRGIPNHYGGFEQFAQYLSEDLVNRGHEVYVYNSHTHPYQKSEWNGVNIIHCKDPENKIGTVGQFIYDLNCILDSRKRNFDIILQLGYATTSIWFWLLPKKAIVITNMDGLEWKRSKFSFLVKKIILFTEMLTVKTSHFLISDSTGIQNYLKNKYSVDSKYIPYGANLMKGVSNETILKDLSLEKGDYSLIVARMEPENSIETILKGFVASETKRKFLVIGNTDNKYGTYIKNKFSDSRIIYLGYVSEIDKLNVLRKNSYLYFHGHTVGGTNPSLLEAMSSSALICAHNNEFNKTILEEDSFYFNCQKCITILLNKDTLDSRDLYISNNIIKVKEKYSWDRIVSEYENFMLSKLNK